MQIGDNASELMMADLKLKRAYVTYVVNFLKKWVNLKSQHLFVEISAGLLYYHPGKRTHDTHSG